MFREIFGSILIVGGIVNFILYIGAVYSEVQLELKTTHLSGIVKYVAFILSYIIEFISDSSSWCLVLFGCMPVILGFILLGWT